MNTTLPSTDIQISLALMGVEIKEDDAAKLSRDHQCRVVANLCTSGSSIARAFSLRFVLLEISGHFSALEAQSVYRDCFELRGQFLPKTDPAPLYFDTHIGTWANGEPA